MLLFLNNVFCVLFIIAINVAMIGTNKLLVNLNLNLFEDFFYSRKNYTEPDLTR